jgi:hypothetical protein
MLAFKLGEDLMAVLDLNESWAWATPQNMIL